MRIIERQYPTEGTSNGWDLVSSVPKDVTLRRKALKELAASGITLTQAAAVFGVSQATIYRDWQALASLVPEFGTDAWRLAYHEREAARLRCKLERDADADEAMTN